MIVFCYKQSTTRGRENNKEQFSTLLQFYLKAEYYFYFPTYPTQC